MTRSHIHHITLTASPEHSFELLHTPSAIRSWWGAARVIVLAREGGVWSAAWGDDEDDPDYISTAVIRVFDPPCRMVLAHNQYYAKAGPLPFEMRSTVEFTVEPHGEGSILRVRQDGFPTDPVADDFYTACEVGWKNTFDNIKRYLEAPAPVRTTA